METFVQLVTALNKSRVRFWVIGVWGANYYAMNGGAICTATERELFLPLNPENELRAGRAAESVILGDITVNFTTEMPGFDFETVFANHRVFRAEGVDIPVARLEHIIESKRRADRPKDRLFLATHEEALRQFLRRPR
jgi:hypothetical protein